VDRADEMPVILICCDSNGEFFAVSLYNSQMSKVANAVDPMKSFLHINQPKFKEICVEGPAGKRLSYPCIRVGHPSDVVVVGSGPLGECGSCPRFSACALKNTPEATEETSGDASPAAEEEVAKEEVVVDPKLEKWIEQEDAKIKKEEAKAKARAQAKSKAKAEAQKKKIKMYDDLTSKKCKDEAPQVVDIDIEKDEAERVVDIDAELETNTGSESSGEQPTDTAEGAEEKTSTRSRNKVRWSELDDSEDELPTAKAEKADHPASVEA